MYADVKLCESCVYVCESDPYNIRYEYAIHVHTMHS